MFVFFYYKEKLFKKKKFFSLQLQYIKMKRKKYSINEIRRDYNSSEREREKKRKFILNKIKKSREKLLYSL